MKERTDAELVALARQGDKQAFGQLVERYQSMAQPKSPRGLDPVSKNSVGTTT